jgi:hypothetical protein
MMNFAINDFTIIYGTIETVPLGKPVVEGVRGSVINRASRFIGCVELSGSWFCRDAGALVMDRVAAYVYGNSGVIIWQAEPARHSDCKPIRGVQAEEPNAAPAPRLYVCSDV